MPGRDQILFIRRKRQAIDRIAVSLQGADNFASWPVPHNHGVVGRCRKPMPRFREGYAATPERVWRLQRFEGLGFEVEYLQALLPVAGGGNQPVAFRGKRERVGGPNENANLLIGAAFSLEFPVHIPDLHLLTPAAGRKILAFRVDGNRIDSTILRFQDPHHLSLQHIEDMDRSLAVATEQEAAIRRKGKGIRVVRKPGPFSELLTKRSPKNDLVSTAGKILSVGCEGESRGVFLVAGKAGNQAASQRPYSNEPVGRQSHNSLAIWRHNHIRHGTAQPHQRSLEFSVDTPHAESRRVRIVIGSDQRTPVRRQGNEMWRSTFAGSNTNRAHKLARSTVDIHAIVDLAATDEFISIGRKTHGVSEMRRKLRDSIPLKIP